MGTLLNEPMDRDLSVPAEGNAMLTPQETEIDAKREACYLMKTETGSSLNMNRIH
jgi:hypothetical protein